MKPRNIAIIGGGINGLVAANYLLRNGHRVTLMEKKPHIGGACVSASAYIGGVEQQYALGASTLGLMQDFVWQETGLADCLQTWVCRHPDLVFFPNSEIPTVLYTDLENLAAELAAKWGERGDLAAFYTDAERVIRFLQEGYRIGRPPSVPAAIEKLGPDLVALWITGSAADLLDHYMTSDRAKLYFSMRVTESGPVSLHEPFSAFTVPMMESGSVFGGNYGYVRGGIWQVTQALSRINESLGAEVVLSCQVTDIDVPNGTIHYETSDGQKTLHVDHLIFATDPQTAARLTGDEMLTEVTDRQRILGTSGKLNLMFRNPVTWKEAGIGADAQTAFRYIFAVDTTADFEAATLAVLGDGADFVPGYYQVYSEGPAMRHMGLTEPFERLAIFFKNLAFDRPAEELAAVESEAREMVLSHISNSEDCVWSRLLTPRDLQQTFSFPGGNIEHTMMVDGQTYDKRRYSGDGERRFYQFGDFENVSICGSSTYPGGSVAGTPAYMCTAELLSAWA